jgi:hypothetical protein
VVVLALADQPRLLVDRVARIAEAAAYEIHGPNRHVWFDETHLLLDERRIVLRHPTLDDSNNRLARARVAFRQQLQEVFPAHLAHFSTPETAVVSRACLIPASPSRMPERACVSLTFL